jgi:hypothetical protein
MSKLWSLYTSQIHQQLRYRGTWLPSSPIELGTVGVMRDGVLDPMTSLVHLEIPYETRFDPAPDGSLDFRSAGAVGVTVKAAGSANQAFSALAGADAGMLISFSRRGGVYLQMRGITIERVEDKHALSVDLLDAVFAAEDRLRWKRDWVVVTDVVRAEVATVIVSQDASGQLELKAQGQIGTGGLVDAGAAFSVVREQGVGVCLLASADLMPLYNGLRVKRNFWTLYDEIRPASEAFDEDAEDVFEDLDPAGDADEPGS